ncbi:MAG: hypothetical protein DMG06_28820 [Acidobacteria bacterium]|nr:MAG: hypothetical protein DMG06_28820 [Acidobacteriota bacterium]
MGAEDLERDGFQVTKKVFISPKDTALLDPVRKRKITICNLFANDGLPMCDIVRVLDEKYEHVVMVLLEQGLIRERRKNPRPVREERRRSLFRKF